MIFSELSLIFLDIFYGLNFFHLHLFYKMFSMFLSYLILFSFSSDNKMQYPYVQRFFHFSYFTCTYFTFQYNRMTIILLHILLQHGWWLGYIRYLIIRCLYINHLFEVHLPKSAVNKHEIGSCGSGTPFDHCWNKWFYSAVTISGNFHLPVALTSKCRRCDNQWKCYGNAFILSIS